MAEISFGAIAQLFPFAFQFDRKFQLLCHGPLIGRAIKGFNKGGRLPELLSVRLPNMGWKIRPLEENLADAFLLQALKERLELKGQMSRSEDGAKFTFLCVPWITDLTVLEGLTITANDLPHYDLTTDMAFLLQIQQKTLKENQRLITELQSERQKLLDLNKNLDAEIERRQRQVVQSAKLASIGELAAGVGHEINNPLAIIKGHVDLLRKLERAKRLDLPKLRRCLKTQDDSISRIAKIVSGLRDYARVDDGMVEPVDAHAAILHTLSFVENIYRKDSIVLVRRLNADKCHFDGNAGRFQQVIMNLLGNARDAIAEGGESGTITLVTENLGKKLKIDVADDGPGISKEHLLKVFDTFFTTKPTGKGTGLGLSISLSIVREFGGTLEVTSKIGEGTCFTIELPTVTPKRVVELREMDEVPSGNLTGKVLIVEDEEEIRSLLRGYLEGFGLTVEEATDGQKAIERLEKEQFYALITDLKMPGYSGSWLLKEIERRGIQQAKVIVITGGIEDDQNPERLGIKINAVINKPFKEEHLYRALAS